MQYKRWWFHSVQCISVFTPRHATPSNQRGGRDCFTEGGWRTQHACIKVQHPGDSRLLAEAKRAYESNIDGLAGIALITQVSADAVIA